VQRRAAHRPSLAAVFAAGLLLLGVPPALAEARTAKEPLCRRYRCTTLLANPSVRVFRATRSLSGSERFRTVYAQSSRGRLTTLDAELVNREPSSRLGPLALNGPWVAYAVAGNLGYNGEGEEWRVRRTNAASGRRETAALASSPSGGQEGVCDGGFPQGADGVTEMTVTSSGAAAWIVAGITEFPSGTNVLGSRRVCDLAPETTAPKVVADSPAIATGSLAAAANVLYWSEGGAARSAPLP
jgi:hypothetical protein